MLATWCTQAGIPHLDLGVEAVEGDAVDVGDPVAGGDRDVGPTRHEVHLHSRGFEVQAPPAMLQPGLKVTPVAAWLLAFWLSVLQQAA